MSELETTPSMPATENSTPVGEPQEVAQVIVKTEKQDEMYVDTPLVGGAGLTQISQDGNNTEGQPKKIDPRQQWINTDRTKPYYCKLCDFNMDSMEVFQHHCMGPRHVKRAIEEFNIKIPKRLEEEDKKKPPPEYNCQTCLITCNSDTAWNAHLLGQKHRKTLEKQGAERAQQKAQEKGFMMQNTMNTGYGRGAGRGMAGRGGGGPIRGGTYNPGHSRKPYDKPVHAVQQPSLSGPIGARDFATYPEPLIGLEYVTEIQVIGQSPRYHCELCDSKFDHNLKFPHLVGSKHRFNVLKEKVPHVASNIRGDVKKRSELSSKLLEEANKLEMMEGRQQVKTRMEKSPFNRVNNQAATRGGLSGNSFTQQTSRGGGHQWQNQRGGGQGGGRGGQAGGRGGQGGARGGGQWGTFGGGQGGARGGGQGNVRGGGQAGTRGGGRGRGNQQGTPYNHQQQSLSNRGGRGRGRATGGGNQNQAWKQDFSYNSTPNQTYSSSSYGGSDDSFQWNTNTQEGGDRMLPAEAFKPRSPSRSQLQEQQQQYSNYHDNFYDDYYGSGAQNTAYNSSNYEYNNTYSNQNTYPSQNTTSQTFQPQALSAGGGPTAGNTGGSGSGGGGGSGSSSVSLLQGAIADLGKLVSSEEDASMALQVSNALTQALLQFRMNNLPQGATDTSAAASSATLMNTGT